MDNDTPIDGNRSGPAVLVNKETLYPRVIGVSGNIGAGKTTITRILESKHGYTRRAFSDPLYKQLWALDPIVYDYEDGEMVTYRVMVTQYGADEAKRRCPMIRKYLRLLGQECGRDIHGPYCWVNHLNRLAKQDKRTAICGVRYEEEVVYVKDNGGIMIHVDSPKETPRDPKAHQSEVFDSSEHADFRIHNGGDLTDLEDSVGSVLLQ